MTLTRAVRMKLQPNEEQEQMADMRWAALMTDTHPELSLLHAIPNGARTSMSVAKRLKATGLRAGVPDLHLPVARGGYHGLWLELKRQLGGKVSDEQRWWHEQLAAQDQWVAVCPGARVVVEPEQSPLGLLSDWQPGPLVKEPAGAVWVSLIPTAVSVTLPVFVAKNL